MNNEQSNIALHRKGHEAFSRGDMQTLTDLIAEDTVWHWTGRGPFAGDHRGRDAVFEQFSMMSRLTAGTMGLEDQHFLANDNKTAALYRFTAVRGNNRLDVMLCEVAEWRDGKLVEEWLYPADQYALDEFWS
jgi:uncharacterized protein